MQLWVHVDSASFDDIPDVLSRIQISRLQVWERSAIDNRYAVGRFTTMSPNGVAVSNHRYLSRSERRVYVDIWK
jgi:hypothetical protein